MNRTTRKSRLIHAPALAAVLSCGIALPAVSADYYLNVTESSSDQGAFTDATKWIDAEGVTQTAWDPQGVYHVATTNPVNSTQIARSLRTPAVTGPVTFPGGQLVFEDNASSRKETTLIVCTTGGGAVFPSGILLKGYSRITPASSVGGGTNPGTASNPYVVDGDITTTLEDAGNLPILKAQASGRAIAFRGRILGSAAKPSLKVWVGDNERGGYSVDFGGSLSNYTGQLDLCAATGYYSSSYNYGLRTVFSTSTFNGKIYPHRNDSYTNNVVPIEFAIAGCEDVFRVNQFGVNHGGAMPGNSKGNFTLQNGMVFEFPVDGASGKCGQFIMTTLQTGYQNATNIGIRLVGNCLGSGTNKFATLSVPKAAAISAANFKLDIVGFEPWNDATLSVEENGDCRTVFVTVPPSKSDEVYLVTSDPATHSGAYYNSVFTNAECWSNGKIPEDGHVYVLAGTNDVLMVARTPRTSSSYEFPEGSSLYLWGQARIHTQLGALTFNDLRSFDGVLGNRTSSENSKNTTGIYKILNAATVTTVSGNITVESGYFNFGCFHDQTFVIDAKLHGTGTVAFSGMWVWDWNLGNYVLRGVNDDFYGKMMVCTGKSYEDYSKLWVSDGRSLGADLAVPTPDALRLTDYVRLVATNSFTIAEASNRGVSIEGNAVIQVAADAVVRIETPLTISGNLYKEGSGTLALAGDATASTGADCLVVTNGTIQLAGANAVAGLTVRLAAGTKLAVEPGIGGKGVDLTSSTIVLDGSFAGVLPLCRDSGAKLRPLQTVTEEVPLFTVNTADKAAFLAMLPQRPPKFYANTLSKWNTPVDDPEAGTTTFSVHVAHLGMTLSFR